MKKLSSTSAVTRETITTIDDLACFLEDYQAQNPEDDCIDLIRSICEENGWIYTGDSEIPYGFDDYCTDGEKLLSLTSSGWEVFDNDPILTDWTFDDGSEGALFVWEDFDYYYVDFDDAQGVRAYPKDWDLHDAVEERKEINDTALDTITMKKEIEEMEKERNKHKQLKTTKQ